LKAEGEPLPRKIHPNFSLRVPQHLLSCQKRRRNFGGWVKIFEKMKRNYNGFGSNCVGPK